MDSASTAPWRRPQGQSNNSSTPNTPGTPSTPCFTPPPPIAENAWSPKRAQLPTSPSQGTISKETSPFSTVNSPSFQTNQITASPSWSPTITGITTSPRPGNVPVFPTNQTTSPAYISPVALAPPPQPPPPPPMPSQFTGVPWRQRAKQNGEAHPTYNSHSPYCQDGSGEANVGQYENLPAALHGTLQKDKKPFTYTPGGIDFSEIRSPRMQRRIDKNARQVSPPPVNPSHNQNELYSQPMAPSAPHFAQTPVRLPFPGSQPLSKLPSPAAAASPTFKPQSSRAQVIVPPAYNSPISLYSKDNASEAYQNQVGELNSAMKGVQVQGGQPTNQNYHQNNETPDQGMPQSRSFRVLQAITSDHVGDENDMRRPIPKPSEDEMKFSGLRKAPIPSRAFQTLQKMTGERDDAADPPEQPYPQVPPPSLVNRSQRQLATRVTIPVQQQCPEQQEGYYPSPSVPASQQPSEAEPKKYMGGHIPSRSFRMLQAMTGGEENDDSYVPEMQPAPEKSDPQQSEVKIYTGGHIPSRSFRILQAMTGEDSTANGGSS